MERVGVSGRPGYRWKARGELSRSIRVRGEVSGGAEKLCSLKQRIKFSAHANERSRKVAHARARQGPFFSRQAAAANPCRREMVRRGGPGAKCSPRGSAARSPSTGLCTCCPHTSNAFAAGSCCAGSAPPAVQHAGSVGSVFSTFVRCARLTLVALVFVTSLLVILAAGVAWLYGGEADEAIRFMEPEPMPEPVPEPVPEASMSMPDRDRELEVLRAVFGVSGAN